MILPNSLLALKNKADTHSVVCNNNKILHKSLLGVEKNNMKIANILSIILALILGIISLQWIFSPEEAANSLSMIYMEGDARNTQVRTLQLFSWHCHNVISLLYN